MATLVFSAVGTMVGGPVGGAVGSLVGSQVDAALFGWPNRQGARLKELDVTTSSYGQPIARHFGRMRVAGQMIWAADLVEHSEVMGGGKGAASVTSYSYAASFAVALASRPILALGRIWADGKLLRGEAGDLKTSGTLRFHAGNGDQACDPLLLSAEGERCSAHRDLAYVVFEDLDLSNFYNRIPSLTFEVIADESFDLSSIIGEIVEEVDAAVPLDGILGLSNEGPLADTLSAIDPVHPLDADCAGARLVLGRDRLQTAPLAMSEATIAVSDDEFAAASGFSRNRAAATEQPVAALRYYEVARDYQPGIQYVTGRPAPGGPRILELPAALEAADARALIERTARRLDWSRDTISWRTGELNPDIAPGSRITFPDVPGVWRVREWEWCDTGVEITAQQAVPVATQTPPAQATDAGQSHPQTDLPKAETALAAFELPYDPSVGGPGTTRLCAAPSSTQANWGGAALYADRGDGLLQPLGPSGRTRNVMGVALTALASASPLTFDRASRLTVKLVDASMQLASVNTRQLSEGANCALLGEELIQFARASSLGNGAWLLEGFVRGCAGTESGIATHLTGEKFVLLDGRAVTIDPSLLGTAASRGIVAIGRGDTDGVRAAIALSGITLRPLPPVHPSKTILPDGTWRLEWTRRARGVQPWRDGIEVPLVEEAESYLLTFGPADAPIARWTTQEPRADLPAEQRAMLASRSPGGWLRVAQQGSYAVSESLGLCAIS